ncbi:hypothetical protein [Williamsia muralis]|uniref:Uncharacterized protein n=1 Tax=Williamsia marianensis TaxID=85044 RepID=A0A2G3PNA6_WILMA|nr:hypothetical protein [Williamsia marianensis]PHV67236.1 hypothetical protein CSW57_13695 [Williamsia marianensis]
MSTEIAVAIIAAVAAVVGPTLVWLASRQQTNDSRALINKDLDLAERLTKIGPSTEEYAKPLIGNVFAQIDALVARDHARRARGKFVRWLWPGYVLIVAGSVIYPFDFPKFSGVVGWLFNSGGFSLVGIGYLVAVCPFYVRSQLRHPTRPSRP